MTPGEHLRSELERIGMDQRTLAAEMKVSRQTINNIVNDRQPISRSMAARLGRLTSRSSDYWLRAAFPDSDLGRSHLAMSCRDSGSHSGVPPPGSSLVNHQIIQAVTSGTIGVEPFFDQHVGLASLHLTLHDFVLTFDGREFDISPGQDFALERGGTVRAQTREWIALPADYVGRIAPASHLIQSGIVVSHDLHIEPGFKGHLQLCLFNAGLRPCPLKGGARILSVEFVKLGSTPSITNRADNTRE